VAPASFGQASLWFLRQVMPCKTAYNTAVQLRLSGALDPAAVEAAVREIARRHESLRTTFTVADGAVLQVIRDELAVDVAIVDLASAPDPEGEARRLAREVAAESFDLDHGPLLRARLLRVGPRDHALVVVMDHIVADGMSLAILWRELEVLYRAFHAGEPSPLSPPDKQYAACVEAQHRWLSTPAFARQLAHWVEHLAGAAAYDLPADRTRPPVRSFRGDLAMTSLPAPLTARLRALSTRDDVSLFAVLLAGLDVLLARCSGQRDVVVMVPFACRQRFAAEQVIGFFANMLVLRAEVPDRLGYRELVQRVNREIMAGGLRQDVPFEKVIEALRPDRSLDHEPLVRIACSFLPAPASALDLPGVEATYGEIPNGGSKFDLHFVISEHGRDLTVSAEYNGDIFDGETIQAHLERYRLLLESAVAAPERAVADLGLLAPAELQRIVGAWNDTGADYCRSATLPDLVTAAAARAPEAPALSFEGQEVCYRELDRRSNRIARCLRARGVGAGALVGIAVDRSIAMVVGLLGILKAGGAYVPLDPAYPRARLSLMAEDSGLRVLVTEDRCADVVPAPAGGLLRLDGDAAEIEARSEEPIDAGIHPESVAYVIYTSGSTGRPKGVQIPHRAVVNFLAAMARCPGLRPADRLLAVTSLSFDIAGLELWLPLTVGACVEVASCATAGDGAALRRRLASGQITVMQATPSTFRLLLEAGWEGTAGLKLLIGGEATPGELADRLVERAGSVWNMYGPTETTIWSCIHRLEKGAPVLIGRPIANTRAYVLDRSLTPAPVGVPGELFIGGDGVAHGYLGRPDLTAERFVPDPFGVGGRLYRTGDLCRFRRDGALEFLGRLDQQLKIRGHRIELGEIEAVLGEHPAVQRAAVVAREDASGDRRLVAYVVPCDAKAGAAAGDLRSHLAAELPEYMVPAAFVVLDAIPLTPNGKIDRRALPAPGRGRAEEAAFVAPRTPAEKVLAGFWADVLGLERVSVRDDFFALGGHSLLGMRVLARVGEAFGVELPLRAVFEDRTVAQLAERVAAVRASGGRPAAPPLVPAPRHGRAWTRGTSFTRR
jgi:amino acid adenylation domain-containing protein